MREFRINRSIELPTTAGQVGHSDRKIGRRVSQNSFRVQLTFRSALALNGRCHIGGAVKGLKLKQLQRWIQQ